MKTAIKIVLASLLVAFAASPAMASRPTVTDKITGNPLLDPPERSATNSMTRDGRITVFGSSASYFVPGDTNGNSDIFTYDRTTKQFERINLGAHGEQGNDQSFHPTISGDGRYIAYGTWATNLATDVPCNHIPGPTEEKCAHILVYDRATKQTVTANVDMNGNLMKAVVAPYNQAPVIINADGSRVAFTAINMDNPEHRADAVVRDLHASATIIASVDAYGNPVSQRGHSKAESISGDGNRVVFTSSARLAPADADDATDVYMRDMTSEQTTLISQTYKPDSTGRHPYAQASNPVISENGQFVAFESDYAGIVPNDGNNTEDVFVRNIAAARTQRVSTARNGGDANDRSHSASINADGSLITYASTASNLVRYDPNHFDVFIHYRNHGVTRRLAPPIEHGQTFNTYRPAVSADGKAIGYQAAPPTLEPAYIPFQMYLYYDPYGNIPFYDSNDLADLL